MDVDYVFECTGKFNSKEKLLAHIKNGAKKVIVSAPCKNADKTIVYGVNENILTKNDQIISAASCTTNCLAPVANVLNENFEIEKGFMTTIHALLVIKEYLITLIKTQEEQDLLVNQLFQHQQVHQKLLVKLFLL